METLVDLCLIIGCACVFVFCCRLIARRERGQEGTPSGCGGNARGSSGLTDRPMYAPPGGPYEGTPNEREWKTTSFVDHSGTLRMPGEPYVDHSGTLRFPGDPFVDCSGTLRFPDEPYVDHSGTLRMPGEPYVDENGDLRW